MGVALNGFSFFMELIGEKNHVGSSHTNGGVALKHPFSFHSNKKGRKSLRLYTLFGKNLKGEKAIHNILFGWFVSADMISRHLLTLKQRITHM